MKTKDRPAQAVDTLRPYVKRAMEDPELREDLLAAFVAARELYGQISNRSGVKGKAEKISDKEFQKEFQNLVSDLSDATDKLKDAGKTHKTRNRVILLTGVTLGVLFNPWTGQQTRDWIMGQVTGDNGDGFEEYGDLSEAGGNGSGSTTDV
jgi:soluble cytochrome b562